MNSIYLANITNNNTFTLNEIKQGNYKYYIVPYIGILECDKKYFIPKNIFRESKLFYGNNKITNLNNLTIQSKTSKYNTIIKNIIDTYKKKFKHKINFPIFVQINEYDKYKKEMFIGGFASYCGIEIILSNDIEEHKDIKFVKWMIAHELLHLFFPSIKSKYNTCWNEGFVDYLSLILNFN